ncbi:MAG: putative Ig domain-containing protein [Candidatus Eisenbacteria bacterium]
MPQRSAVGVRHPGIDRGPGSPNRWLLRACVAAGLTLAAGRAFALPLTVVTNSLPAGTAGVPYSQVLAADLGTTPYSWTLDSGALPSGLTLDGPTGAISGTATLAGTSGFVVFVTDALGDTASRALSIEIAPAAASTLAFTVQPSDVLVGATMTPAVQVLVTDAFANPVPGESVALSLVGPGSLAGGAAVLSDGAGLASFAGLSVDVAGSKQIEAASGVLTPVTSASFAVLCPALTISPSVLSAAQLGAPYSSNLSATGGVPPEVFTISAGALPSGLTLSPAGSLSGTPTVSGVANFSVTVTDAAGCTGEQAYALSVVGVPVAVSDLAVARTTSGNDGVGTIRLMVTFTLPVFAAAVEVYRAPFGGYPRYDDSGGVLPAIPSYPPGLPWVLTAVGASGQTDEPASRDAWSYVVFVKNSFGQVSAVSNRTAPAPDYALGDVSDGLVAGQGDNQVTDADVSLLGAHYGISGGALTTAGVHFLDVGPTVDLGLGSRPFTDGRIDFEDLIVFATNYGEVSAPQARIAAAEAARRAAVAPERFAVEAPAMVAAGERFQAVVSMAAAGRAQGLSAELGFDAAVAEPLSVESAGWVEAQHGVVLSARAATFDAALLGARSVGLQGGGELARVTFRALRAGDPVVRLARVQARDGANRPLAASELAFGLEPSLPARTLLLAPSPNPAQGATQLGFALAREAQAELAIHAVDGRRVRVLARGTFAAGSHRFTWDGRDDAQHDVAPGLYFVRLDTGGDPLTRTLIHLR